MYISLMSWTRLCLAENNSMLFGLPFPPCKKKNTPPNHFQTTQPRLQPTGCEAAGTTASIGEGAKLQTVPVLIPVHSPDHSHADTQGQQHKWSHGELFAQAGEAGGKMREPKEIRKCVPPADRPCQPQDESQGHAQHRGTCDCAA